MLRSPGVSGRKRSRKVTLPSQRGKLVQLRLGDALIDAHNVHWLLFGLHILVDAHDHQPALLDRLLVLIGAALNLALDVSLFDGPEHAPQRFEALDIGQSLVLEAGREGFDGVGPTNRIGDVGHAAFVGGPC